MLTCRSNQILSQKLLYGKCKVENCSRSRQLASCGMSNFCKVHEVFIFLVKLKYSMKKLFGTLSSGFAVLQRESGEYFAIKDLCNFMNFLMIPFLLEDVQNVFEVLGKKYRNKNFSVIKIEEMKQTMKSKEYHEIIDAEIRIIIEVIASSIKLHGMKNVINNLDQDQDGNFNIADFIRTFRIRETQAFLFFHHVFKQTITSISKFIALFPSKNNELFLNLSEINVDSTLVNFFSGKSSKEDAVFQKRADSPEILPLTASNFLDQLRETLRESYHSFSEAFAAFANSKMEIGYFQVQRLLIECGFPNTENHCRSVISFISHSTKITLQHFKEYWLKQSRVCNYHMCTKHKVNFNSFCEDHINIAKRKALVLLEKVKYRTSVWKSPRRIGNFFRSLERASGKHDMKAMKTQLNQILPLADLPKGNIASLHSILGKLN